jgi:hypothetical protein
LTRELAAVFGPDEGETAASLGTETGLKNAAEEEAGEMGRLPFPKEVMAELDPRYWSCVPSLLEQTVWSKKDLSSLARRHALMPNAMVEAVNTWGAETLGDFLLLEKDGVWILNRDCVNRTTVY